MKQFYALFILFFTSSPVMLEAQKSTGAEQEIGSLVALSFRLQTNTKPSLDSMHQIAIASGNDKILAFHEFTYKAWQLYFDTTLPAATKPALESALTHITEQSPYAELRAHAVFWKGTLHRFEGNDDDLEGLSYVLKGKKLLEEIRYETLPYATEYYKMLSDIYYYFGDYANAILYAEKQLPLPPSQFIGRHSLYDDLGVFYMRSGMYAKAEWAFNQSLQVSRQQHRVAYEGMVRGNLGNLKRLSGQYLEALPYLYESISQTAIDIPESAAQSHIYVADCLLHLDSISKAREYLQPPAFTIPVWSQPGYNLSWYQTQALYYERSGNTIVALRYKDSLIALTDSIRTERDNKKLIVLESSLLAEQFINDRKALENDRYWRNIVIVVLGLLSATIVGWLWQRRRQDKRMAVQESQHASKMLAQANHQLTLYLQSLKEKNELIEQISRQLDEARNDTIVPESAVEPTENHLEKLQSSVLFTEQDWEKFKQLFEQAFPGFFINLITQYPDLSPAETRLMALERLEITDREKGNMLNISADSVKKARYRLRKKYPDLLLTA